MDTHYGSFVTVTCLLGYWVRPGVFSRDVTCTEEGVWEPPLSHCHGSKRLNVVSSPLLLTVATHSESCAIVPVYRAICSARYTGTPCSYQYLLHTRSIHAVRYRSAIQKAAMDDHVTNRTSHLYHDVAIAYEMARAMTKGNRLTPLLVGTIEIDID